MIISASRRTDIPAFYADWFLKRLKAGRFAVRNPFNAGQVTEYRFDGKAVDCIVFWTKYPKALYPLLNSFDATGIPYYFLFTLTPYDNSVEPSLPPKEDAVELFHACAAAIGKRRMVWRYDPILLSDRFTHNYHEKNFARLCSLLQGTTTQCIISFFSPYKKSVRNCVPLSLHIPDDQEKISLAGKLKEIADSHTIELRACADPVDYSEIGVKPASCIDGELINELTGREKKYRKDPNQRPACGCVRSIDVGAYHTCLYGCLYCYANSNHQTAQRNARRHDLHSPLLIGYPAETDRVTIREEP